VYLQPHKEIHVNRNSIVRAALTTSAALAVLSVGVSSFARPPYVAVLKKAFPKAETINCKSCHEGKPPAVNAYGKAIKGVLDKAKDKKTLTEAQVMALCKKGCKPEGVK
jgi:hypothetical protein